MVFECGCKATLPSLLLCKKLTWSLSGNVDFIFFNYLLTTKQIIMQQIAATRKIETDARIDPIDR